MDVMKKLAGAMVITAGLVWAQSTTPQMPPPSGQGESTAGSTKSTQSQPGARSGRPMRGPHEMEMQEIQASLAKMHALLNSMRAGYATMSPKDQPAMQANIEMWQMMLDHMDRMAQHMQSIQGGMGPGGGMQHHHGGMGMNPNGPGPGSQAQPGTPPQPPPQ